MPLGQSSVAIDCPVGATRYIFPVRQSRRFKLQILNTGADVIDSVDLETSVDGLNWGHLSSNITGGAVAVGDTEDITLTDENVAALRLTFNASIAGGQITASWRGDG